MMVMMTNDDDDQMMMTTTKLCLICYLSIFRYCTKSHCWV